MPVIIDTNCFACVFSSKNKHHLEFKPILEWIIKGNGIMIIGGTKYEKELIKDFTYQKIIRLLREIGKVKQGNTLQIDNQEKEIKKKLIQKGFNDQHLVAMVIVTKCRIICSNDKESIQFVTLKNLYPKGALHPVYYSSSKNKSLLCDKYIDDSYKPAKKTIKRLATKALKSIA